MRARAHTHLGRFAQERHALEKQSLLLLRLRRYLRRRWQRYVAHIPVGRIARSHRIIPEQAAADCITPYFIREEASVQH